jgi:protoheme IX farnesyltransferase
VVGYVAASGALDSGALILFLILVFWQMPHFYAIAIYRHADYKKAGLPVLPVAKGFQAAKIQIVAYMVAFVLSLIALKAFDYAGWVFLALSGLLALSWLARGLAGFKAKNDNTWARGVFIHSLVVISVLSLLVALGSVLP